MKKLEILIGCSNSGKSTYAKEQWEANPTGVLIVNRDNIRNLIFSFSDETINSYYQRKDLNTCEKQVTHYENLLIKEGLAQDKHVICDATHLEIKYLERFNYYNIPLELKWFDIPVNEAIDRDAKRTRKVGAEIIRRQYEKYKTLKANYIQTSDIKTLHNDPTKPHCIIFDVDGTLAHNNGIRSPFDWDKVHLDTRDEPVCNLYSNLSFLNFKYGGEPIIVCSGRDEVCREATEHWLTNYANPSPYKLYMRKKGDMRPDWQVKFEMWEEICKDFYISFMCDDRNQICDYARSLGLKVFQVEYNNF